MEISFLSLSTKFKALCMVDPEYAQVFAQNNILYITKRKLKTIKCRISKELFPPMNKYFKI